MVLEPENWVGQRLPIADSLDIDLSAGNWTVLLHRHDCPVCREQVPRYEMRATAGEQIAIVEVPPYGEIPDHKTQGLHGGCSSRASEQGAGRRGAGWQIGTAPGKQRVV